MTNIVLCFVIAIGLVPAFANAATGSKDLFKLVESINGQTQKGKELGGSDCASGSCGTVMSDVTFVSNDTGDGIAEIAFTSLFNQTTFATDAALVGQLVDFLRSKGYVFQRQGPNEDGAFTYAGPTLPKISCDSNRNSAGLDEYNCDIVQRLGIE